MAEKSGVGQEVVFEYIKGETQIKTLSSVRPFCPLNAPFFSTLVELIPAPLSVPKMIDPPRA